MTNRACKGREKGEMSEGERANSVLIKSSHSRSWRAKTPGQLVP